MRHFGDEPEELSGADIQRAMREHLRHRRGRAEPDLLGAAALLLGLACVVVVLWWVVL